MGYSRKKSKQKGVEDIRIFSNYFLPGNKPLLALFSLFTNAITQLAASAIAIASYTETLLLGTSYPSDCK